MFSNKSRTYDLDLGQCSVNPNFQDEDEPRDQDQKPVQEYNQIQPYAGMPREVLLLYSCQARYRVPREILFWLIVTCSLVLVAVTVLIISVSPACLSWWRTSPLYQVYPRSFRDSDGDGVGDLNGVRQSLSHFVDLNIKSVWISSFFKSPMKDFGYDVEDFRAIDPIFGTMKDFDDLLAEMHQQGLKLIMDFIPNHTSDKHLWFNLSRARDPSYQDYYVWSDCDASDARPNNWVSVFGNSSWTFDEVRGQCYLHQFLKEQPDLNLRSAGVQREMKDLMTFWLRKGVDGFRMDSVKHILEATHLRDEPQVDPKQTPESITSEEQLHHDFTTSQLGLHDLLRGWRAEMDAFSREPGRYRLMLTDSYDEQEPLKTMMYYGTPQVKEADFPLNFYLLDVPQNRSGWWVQHLVHVWMSNMPEGRWPNWLVGNHDRPRMASRAGQRSVRVLNMLLLTLPGTPVTYYGEEIGMENIEVTADDLQDPLGKLNISKSRDPQRSPMQWSADLNAGFNTKNNLTWLPVHPDYTRVNVEVQRSDEGSVLAQYRRLSSLRQAELALLRGWFCFVHVDDDVFVFLREVDGLRRAFLVVLNFGEEDAVTDLSSAPELPEQLQVLISTDPDNDGKVFQKSRIPTAAGEGLLVQFHSNTRFNPEHRDRCWVSEKTCYLEVLDLMYKC